MSQSTRNTHFTANQISWSGCLSERGSSIGQRYLAISPHYTFFSGAILRKGSMSTNLLRFQNKKRTSDLKLLKSNRIYWKLRKTSLKEWYHVSVVEGIWTTSYFINIYVHYANNYKIRIFLICYVLFKKQIPESKLDHPLN